MTWSDIWSTMKGRSKETKTKSGIHFGYATCLPISIKSFLSILFFFHFRVFPLFKSKGKTTKRHKEKRLSAAPDIRRGRAQVNYPTKSNLSCIIIWYLLARKSKILNWLYCEPQYSFFLLIFKLSNSIDIEKLPEERERWSLDSLLNERIRPSPL